jgi:hypothetical protein
MPTSFPGVSSTPSSSCSGQAPALCSDRQLLPARVAALARRARHDMDLGSLAGAQPPVLARLRLTKQSHIAPRLESVETPRLLLRDSGFGVL